MAIHAVYCTQGDYGIYIMQHYYHRLATYCMWIRIAINFYYFLLSSFTSLGTGRLIQEAEPVQGAYPQPRGT